MKHSSLKVLAWIVCSVALLAGAAQGSEIGARIGTRALTPANLLDGTVRLRTRTVERDYTVKTGWGAAFAVDLSKYGLVSSRYLLTAAHLINTSNGQIMPRGDLEIEVDTDTWAPCRVVAMDQVRDLCLIESSVRLPVVSKISTSDDTQHLGEKVVIVGCPRGVPPCVSHGTLTDFEPPVSGIRWQAAAQFNHGNSGGPVYNALTGTVIGVAVAGISDGFGDMRPDTALFAPYTEVRRFLDVAVASGVLSHSRRR
jgi:S1-C subfamily serine protease